MELKILDEQVRLTLESDAGTETLTAAHVVVTAGAWTEKLLHRSGVQLPPLRVTQEQPAHFAIADAQAVWPGFNHYKGDGAEYGNWYTPVYGMETPGEGVKAGWHGSGPVVDPDRRSFRPEPAQLAALQDYARKWLPGVDADSFDAISCTYTTTPDENFILDRIGPVIVGAGFSGHGFKFVPVIGRILADLATSAQLAPAIFRTAKRVA